MRSAAIIVVVFAGVVILNFSASSPACGAGYKLEMPKEAFGFSGTLSAQVAKAPDKVYGWFEVKVVKVISFARDNQTKLKTPAALTKVWKDKYVAVLGVKGMEELKVGDTVTVVAAVHEVHLRASKVSKDKPAETKPAETKSGGAAPAQEHAVSPPSPPRAGGAQSVTQSVAVNVATTSADLKLSVQGDPLQGTGTVRYGKDNYAVTITKGSISADGKTAQLTGTVPVDAAPTPFTLKCDRTTGYLEFSFGNVKFWSKGNVAIAK